MSAFSKKTGDYGVLSSTDVKVLALAYELECQLGVERGKNLRTAPLQQVMYVLTESLLFGQWKHTQTRIHTRARARDAHTCTHTYTCIVYLMTLHCTMLVLVDLRCTPLTNGYL